jgi:DNA-binding HxlR family transcriptional regulator
MNSPHGTAGLGAVKTGATLNMSSQYTPLRIRPADLVLRTVRGRWAMHIIKLIGDRGTLHFGALKRAIPGISDKVLTEQLRRFERAGILEREPKPAARPEMLYSLTSRGRELKTFVDGLKELGERWQGEDANEAGRAD